MHKRALLFGSLQPGDRVSVPRPGNKGGREIATFLAFDPETMDYPDGGDVIVQRPNGKLKRWPLWRIHQYIDEKLRRKLQEEEAEREQADDDDV